MKKKLSIAAVKVETRTRLYNVDAVASENINAFSPIVTYEKIGVAKALYDNEAEWPDELAFERGEILRVLDERPCKLGSFCCSKTFRFNFLSNHYIYTYIIQ
ncbi:unnamed protein product [Toxocara canis]|uniref:SH3 domain-containing protein n=1 Tax=Toxocara canis TaxID=6265 RepID=A0A183V494_TOXCA|nr:unnamed protein product [Toxocara canis]